ERAINVDITIGPVTRPDEVIPGVYRGIHAGGNHEGATAGLPSLQPQLAVGHDQRPIQTLVHSAENRPATARSRGRANPSLERPARAGTPIAQVHIATVAVQLKSCANSA